jgi:hypothetical protein
VRTASRPHVFGTVLRVEPGALVRVVAVGVSAHELLHYASHLVHTKPLPWTWALNDPSVANVAHSTLVVTRAQWLQVRNGVTVRKYTADPDGSPLGGLANHHPYFLCRAPHTSAHHPYQLEVYEKRPCVHEHDLALNRDEWRRVRFTHLGHGTRHQFLPVAKSTASWSAVGMDTRNSTPLTMARRDGVSYDDQSRTRNTLLHLGPPHRSTWLKLHQEQTMFEGERHTHDLALRALEVSTPAHRAQLARLAAATATVHATCATVAFATHALRTVRILYAALATDHRHQMVRLVRGEDSDRGETVAARHEAVGRPVVVHAAAEERNTDLDDVHERLAALKVAVRRAPSVAHFAASMGLPKSTLRGWLVRSSLTERMVEVLRRWDGDDTAYRSASTARTKQRARAGPGPCTCARPHKRARVETAAQ